LRAFGLLNSNKNQNGIKVVSRDKTFTVQDGRFYPYNGEKSDSIISFLDFSDCVIDSVDVSFGVDSNDLGSTIELKAYEELSLDPTQDYIIRYQPQKDIYSENSKKYFVFVAKEAELTKKFPQKPVDFIAYAPLLIGALFEKNFLPDTNDFAFVYMDETDAFVTVFSKGAFQYCKGSQKLSLTYLANKFCEIASERIQTDEFLNYLLNGKLAFERPDIQDTLNKFWTQFFTTISEILLHAKRTYKIDEYAAVYVGTSSGAISQIEEISKGFVTTKVLPFEFNLGNGSGIDILTRLLPLYYECENKVDFSIFHRPPPFFKRDSGKALSLTAASVGMALLYPIIMFGPYEAYLGYKTASINSYVANTSAQKIELEAKISAIVSALKKDEEQFNTLKQEYDKSVDTLKDLASIKTNYSPRAITIVEIAKAVSDSKIRLERLDINETNATLICISKNSSNISTLITTLAKIYKKSPSTPNIKNENGLYRAEIILQNIAVLP
jgi:hypothetical protein